MVVFSPQATSRTFRSFLATIMRRRSLSSGDRFLGLPALLCAVSPDVSCSCSCFPCRSLGFPFS